MENKSNPCKWDNWIGKNLKNIIADFTDQDILLRLKTGEKINITGFHKITITGVYALVWINRNELYSYPMNNIGGWSVI